MKSILMVDDEAHILDVVKLTLERCGNHHVDTAASARDAMDLLSSQDYDVIVSDYEMPGMNGIDLLKAIRAGGDGTPFIMLTARGNEKVAIESLCNGADRYLKRTTTSHSWLTSLRAAIEEAVHTPGDGKIRVPPLPRFPMPMHEVFRRVLEMSPRTSVSLEELKECSYPEDLPYLEAAFDATLSDGMDRSLEYRQRSSDGGWRWHHICISSDDGRVLSDTEDIDWMRDARVESDRVWKLISDSLESAPVEVDIIDDKWNLCYSNRYPSVGDKCYRVIKGAEAPCEGCGMKEAFTVGHCVRMVYREEAEEVESVYVPSFDSDGRPVNAVRLQAQCRNDSVGDLTLETILETNRHLHLLTSITRHDILNQLTAMMGYLDLYDELPEKREMIISRMKELITNVDRQVTFTRSYQKLGVTAPSWHDCETCITSAAEELDMPDGVVQVMNRLPLIFGDPMLERVIVNILSNSMMHGGHVTRIKAWFEEGDGKGSLFISDDGKGIPDDKKERIFERGFGDNTGYGLFLVRNILEITGITITETGKEGEGACFRLDLPSNVYMLKD